MTRDRPGARCWLAAALAYVGLTVLITWPVVPRMASALAGWEAKDSLQYAWNLWWAREAFVELHQPVTEVTTLYYPLELEHPLLGITPFLDWIAIGFGGLLSPTLLYNLVLLTSFPLVGLATFALVSDQMNNPLAAFLAGAIFCFHPSRMGHALAGHLTHMVSWPMLLYLVFLVRLWKRPDVKTAILCGIWLAISLQVAIIQTAYFIAPVTIVVCLHQLPSLLQGFRCPRLRHLSHHPPGMRGRGFRARRRG